MGFFTPWFLAGAVAVGLPVWLHLLRKHRTTPLPFSSLMFFEQHVQSSIKHRRLRYLLLFALRAALIMLLVLAFAQPYIRQNILPSRRTGEVTVLAIDNSFSMRTGDRFERAKQEARSAIGRLGPGERAEVLAFGQRVQAMGEVTDDHTSLNAAVAAIQLSDAKSSFAELTRAVRSIANSLHLPLHLHVYSDMQQSGLPANFNDLRLNADVRLDPHPLETKEVPNFAVENVVAPRRVYENGKTRVLATVASYGAPKAMRTVSLELNGRTVDSKQVEVPENGRASVEFLSLDVPYGRNKGDVKIDSADSLAADDIFYFSVERADPRQALFVREAGNDAALGYFKTALAASGQAAFEVDPATTEQTANLNPSKYAFVVLADVGTLPPAFENELREYVRTGGSVLITLGRNAAVSTKVPVTDQRIEATRYSGREGAMFQTAASLDSSHPSIQNDNRWDDVKFYRAIRVTPGSARVVARLTDQTPLVMDQQMGDGHVVVFASTFDNIDNDFPVHPAFVPFVEQTARYLGRLDSGPSSVLVGTFGELRDSKEVGAAVDVVDPKGGRVLSLEEATKAQNIQFEDAGFYDIRRPNGRNELVAVNSDRRESDLTPASPDTLTLWQNTANGAASSSGATTAAERRPMSVWWYVMLAVLALAVAESLLGNQHLSVDKEAA
ncbi:MAG TPA: BatA domain-containing protein [Bryobacteraceae bacterium]|nr:BatA domain-containing protein [Bryobacteraceae bacterium]